MAAVATATTAAATAAAIVKAKGVAMVAALVVWRSRRGRGHRWQQALEATALVAMAEAQ